MMTAKKNTRRPTTADTAAPASPAPAGDSPAAAVQAALTASPGATTVTIAGHAGVSVTAARKTLTALEAAGYASRSVGERTGPSKPPTIWHPTPPAADAALAALAEHTVPAPAVTVPGVPDTSDAARLAETAATAATAALTALRAGDITTALTELDTARDHTTQARRAVKTALTRHTRTGPAMRPGRLRDRVRDHLTANPGASLTPYEISRVLGNSSGAIANALDRLTELGHVQLASEHPRRYITTG
jgi:DNA-binding MarR family transcriptional regulator